MSQELSVYKILNTELEMSSIPLMGDIKIKFSRDIGISDALGRIYIIKSKDLSAAENLQNTSGDFPRYDKRHLENISISIDKDDKSVAVISPKNGWEESCLYRGYVTKGIRSSATPIDDRISRFSVEDGSYYEIRVLSRKNNINKFAVKIFNNNSESGVILADITKEFSYKSMRVLFSENYSPEAGDVIPISREDGTTLKDDFIFEFKTSEGIKYSYPTEKSTRLSKEDIESFYSSPIGFDKPNEDVKKNKYTISTNYKNKIIVEFDDSVSELDLSDVNISINSSEAFDNIHLSDMGLFDPEVKYSASLKSRGNRLIIELSIPEDETREDDENTINGD